MEYGRENAQFWAMDGGMDGGPLLANGRVVSIVATNRDNFGDDHKYINSEFTGPNMDSRVQELYERLSHQPQAPEYHGDNVEHH